MLRVYLTIGWVHCSMGIGQSQTTAVDTGVSRLQDRWILGKPYSLNQEQLMMLHSRLLH